MKSIPIVGTLLGVFSVNVTGAAEVVDGSSEGIEQLANFDDLAQARSGVADIGRVASLEGSMSASNTSEFSRPATASENGGNSDPLTPEQLERMNQKVFWATADGVVGDANGLSKSGSQLQGVDQATQQESVSGDAVVGDGVPKLVPARLAADDGQSILSSTSLNGFGSGSAPMQASSAALFALQSGPGPWTEHYEYDALGRLTKVTFATGAVTNYTLDNAGNRTNVTTTVP